METPCSSDLAILCLCVRLGLLYVNYDCSQIEFNYNQNPTKTY